MGGFHEHFADQGVGWNLALVPVLQDDEEGGGVVLETAADEVEASEHDGAIDVRVFADDGVHLPDDAVGALEGGAVGEIDGGDVVALVSSGTRPRVNFQAEAGRATMPRKRKRPRAPRRMSQATPAV